MNDKGPEDQATVPVGPRAAIQAVLATAAAMASDQPPPERDPRDNKIEQLQAHCAEEIERTERLRKNIQTIAADRDKWKLRAEKAEAAGDGLALERVERERDGLKKEVASVTRKLNEVATAFKEQIGDTNRKLQTAVSDATTAQHRVERLTTTLEGMQKARDRAFEDRDRAIEDRNEVMKRVADLEAKVKELSPKPKQEKKPEPKKK